MSSGPDLDALLRFALDPAVVPPEVESVETWWDATTAHRARWELPVDRAFAGGVAADRLGFAFAGGYAEALRALVPGLVGISALCATEQGGNHPRAIRTTVTPASPGHYTLTGHKRWATLASAASSLLVVASTGLDATGKNRLRVVRVPTTAPGVTLLPASVPFVPEIPHAEVVLEQVRVTDADLLPGDGYDAYLKPFRTLEDLHVHAALAGYLVGVARRRGFPRELLEQLLAVAIATRALAAADTTAATTHLALAGLLDLVTRIVVDVERVWAASPDAEHARWQRDRALLQVAGKARTARRERARLAASGPPDLP